VVEKRRLARAFNAMVLGGGAKARDGRTEKRRARLLQELGDGLARGKRALSPIDVLVRVQALLDLDEPLGSIRKVCPVRHRVEPSDELVATLRRLHAAYGFSAAAYGFVGVEREALERAGVVAPPPRPGLARGAGKGRVRGAA
jgi:hypothetical protein